jgi:hypothetical protein
MIYPRSSYERDLWKLIPLVIQYKSPILISSAGGDGSDEHVDTFLEITKELSDKLQNEYTT